MSDVNLVKLTKKDIELVRQWRNSKEVAGFMYTDKYISEEDQSAWFENIDWDRNIYWLIEFEGKKLGLASVNGISSVLNSCYWAFYLGDTSVRGAGIGAKVEYNVLEYVFDQLNLNKLRCEVFVHNNKVIKCMRNSASEGRLIIGSIALKMERNLMWLGSQCLKANGRD